MKNYSIVISTLTRKKLVFEVPAKSFDAAVKYVKKMYPNAVIESVMVDL